MDNNILTKHIVASVQKPDSLTKDDELIIIYIEVSPSFPGGQEGLKKYIENNFNWTQGQLTVQGEVFAEFWIEPTGDIKDAKAIRGLCDTCDTERKTN